MRVVYPSNRYLASRVRLFVDALIEQYDASIERARMLDRAPATTPLDAKKHVTKERAAR